MGTGTSRISYKETNSSKLFILKLLTKFLGYGWKVIGHRHRHRRIFEARKCGKVRVKPVIHHVRPKNQIIRCRWLRKSQVSSYLLLRKKIYGCTNSPKCTNHCTDHGNENGGRVHRRRRDADSQSDGKCNRNGGKKKRRRKFKPKMQHKNKAKFRPKNSQKKYSGFVGFYCVLMELLEQPKPNLYILMKFLKQSKPNLNMKKRRVWYKASNSPKCTNHYTHLGNECGKKLTKKQRKAAYQAGATFNRHNATTTQKKSTLQISHCESRNQETISKEVTNSADRPKHTQVGVSSLQPHLTAEELLLETRQLQEVADTCDKQKTGGDDSGDADWLEEVRPLLTERSAVGCSISRAAAAFPITVNTVSRVDNGEKSDAVTQRLKTYAHFKSDVMPRLTLAEAGFVSLEVGDQVECVECKLKLWNFVERVDAMAIHQAHALQVCPLLRDIRMNLQAALPQDMLLQTLQSQTDSALPSVFTTTDTNPDNGQSVLQHLQGLTTLEQYQKFMKENLKRETESLVANLTTISSKDMKWEVVRQKTFASIGVVPMATGKQLAAAGMTVERHSSEYIVKCVFCNFTYSTHQPQRLTASEIVSKHRETHFSCYLRDGNIPHVLEDCCWGIPESDDNSSAASLLMLGVSTGLSKHPELAVESRRQATFLTYPYNAAKMATDLVSHGYFYEGKGDSVTCFSCGVVSSDWRRNETVFQRHARSSSNCQFLIGKMGAEAIHEIVRDLGVYEPPAPQDRINTVTTRMLRPRWDSTPVQTALSMGTGREDVRLVVGNRIKRGDGDFVSVAEIVKAVSDHKAATSSSAALPAPPTLPEYTFPEQETAQQSEEQNDTSVADTPHADTPVADSPQADTMEVTQHSTTSASEIPTSDEGIRALSQQFRQRLLCKICLSEAASIIYLPCAHLMSCSECSAAMTACPVCRQDIKGTITVNYSAISVIKTEVPHSVNTPSITPAGSTPSLTPAGSTPSLPPAGSTPSLTPAGSTPSLISTSYLRGIVEEPVLPERQRNKAIYRMLTS